MLLYCLLDVSGLDRGRRRRISEDVYICIQVQEVVGLLYEYIKMLREIGPQEWVFKELQDMTNMEFRFVEDDHPDEYAVNLSSKS